MRWIGVRWVVAAWALSGCGPQLLDDDAGDSAGSDGDPTAADPTEGDADNDAVGDDAEDAVGDSTGGAQDTGPPDPSDDATSDPTDDTGSDTQDSTTGPSFEPQLCPGDGELAIAMSGMNLDHADGTLVWVSAAQPEEIDGVWGPDNVVVRISDTIDDGTFATQCPLGLSENFNYPSFVVIIDADGSGGCSDDDLVFMQQLFGWADSQVYTFDGPVATAESPKNSWVVTEQAWVPVGTVPEVWGVPLCEYY